MVAFEAEENLAKLKKCKRDRKGKIEADICKHYTEKGTKNNIKCTHKRSMVGGKQNAEPNIVMDKSITIQRTPTKCRNTLNQKSF